MSHSSQITQSFATTDYPRDAWYAAAWDTEVTHEIFARTVCERPLVLYRRGDGVCVALEDACWHRMLPLAKGRLEGDLLVCGYHGLIYESHGRCVSMPSQQTVNPAACVRSYPVAEKHRFVWVWMGDPALADAASIPDLHWNHDAEWASDGETIYANCNYKLVVDNLMDLTHESFVHRSSIGNRSVAEAPFDVSHGPRHATVARWMLGIDAPPFWRQQLGKPGPVDRWQIIRFEAPSTVTIDVGVAPAGTGAPQGDRSQGVNGYVLNTMTPETQRTCHYFWAFARNYRLTEQRLTTELRQGVHHIFREDEIVLAAQQQAVDRHPGRCFYNLNIDAGAMWARRLIDQMVEAELKEAPQAV